LHYLSELEVSNIPDRFIEEFDDAINDLVHVPAAARWNYATVDQLAIGKITLA